LLDLDRRNIVFLGDVSHPEISERAKGLRDAIGRKAKLTILPCAFTRSAGLEVMLAALSRLGDVDGVAAASDMIALGAMDALRQRRKRIPHDVAVVGYDDTAFEADLTSVRQEWVLAGATLAKKVLKVIKGEAVKSEQLPVKLIVRGSSRKA
jgi:DNA-binding LacI/PurR family transcriptional regulator